MARVNRSRRSCDISHRLRYYNSLGAIIMLTTSLRSGTAFTTRTISSQGLRAVSSIPSIDNHHHHHPLPYSHGLHLCSGRSSSRNSITSSPFRSVGRQYGNGRPTFESYAAAQDNNEDAKTVSSLWNVAGVRKETDRLILRCLKKIGKASSRYQKGREVMEELLTNPDATEEELEACPDVDLFQRQLEELRARLAALRALEERLPAFKGVVELPDDVAASLLALEVRDAPPSRLPQHKKQKGPSGSNNGPRLPYRRYYATDDTEIRVGKQAEDNDELSVNPVHRNGDDWWMHASGCPGSHVVIRCNRQVLPSDVKADAAALAARQSKCQGGVIKVSLTRCRNVSKPYGAKAGLVHLSGDVETVTVNMKEAEKRLTRLDATVVV